VKTRIVVLGLVGVLAGGAFVAACSSSSGSGGGTPDAATDSATATDSAKPSDAGTNADVANCVPTTTKNNAQGVGGYCTPSGNECTLADGATTICTADFSQDVPPGAWFCTGFCKPDASDDGCGTGGLQCITVASVSVCVPPTCMAFVKAFEEAGAAVGDP
jgi:hypothetical protein